MTITNAVIFRINQLLKDRKMTKRQLAQSGGISEGTLASVYKQIARGVSLKTIYAISKGFGMTMAEFLDDDVFRQIEIEE